MIEKYKEYLKNNFSNGPKAKKILAIATPIFVVGVMSMCVVANARKTVTINVDGNEETFVTYKRTIKDVLKQAGVELGPKDKVEPALEKKLVKDEAIEVRKAVNVEVVSKDKTISIVTAEATIGDMLEAESEKLKAENIEFDKEEDEVTPSLDSKIEDNLSIQLVDVEVSNEVSTDTIAYDTLTENDNTIEVNTTKVKQAGQEGQVEVTYKVTKKNGKEVSREQVSSKVLKETVTEIILQGTAKVYASRGGESGVYKDVVYCQATAYTGGDLTATGSVPTYNPSGISTISVDPSVIPLGSLVYVDGYGKAIAADTGGAIQGNIIDVYVNSNSDAINWGRQHNIPVYIIAYPGEW
ncbi:MAG: ubiquitin-like domain-containing protein [Clostridium sp.]|nr:ubiquitin-like domain-containing protein [Clostridium sp.]